MPDFSHEDDLQQASGHEIVIGVDEVGRGPLAGPVVAAAVYIPDRRFEWLQIVNDSKKLTAKKRDTLNALIHEHCVCAVAEVTVDDIDKMNILQASLHAMTIATHKLAEKLSGTNYACLIDGHIIPAKLQGKSRALKKGDSLSLSIACASIIAKVYRDTYMQELATAHPHYGWESNMGYGSKKHMDAIKTHGITEHHRKSFAPVKEALLADAA